MTTIGCNAGWKVVTYAERHWTFNSIIPRRSIAVMERLSHINISTKVLRKIALCDMGVRG